MNTEQRVKISREILVQQLIARDGLACQHPDHDHILSEKELDGPMQITIDHTEPQVWCKDEGWTDEQIWSLSNLTLMCKRGNADKGSRRYLNGILEPKPVSRFVYRRAKRLQRAEVCTICEAGRKLGPDEFCSACQSGPMPHRFPRWAKVSPKECLHDGTFWCWVCSCGLVDLPSATHAIMFGGRGEGGTIEVPSKSLEKTT